MKMTSKKKRKQSVPKRAALALQDPATVNPIIKVLTSASLYAV
jgi:hypothetical protein